MFVFEGEVFEFGFDGKESQPVSQGGVDVECLARNLVLLAGEHGAEGAHVVQAVGHLDENDPDILRHGEQQPPEVLGLGRGLVAEDTARNFGQSVDNRGYLLAEVVLDVLDGVLGVLDYIVEQRGAYRGGAQPNLLAHDAGHGNGVEYVGLARTTAYALVGLFGKFECTLDDLYFLAVIGVEIPVEQFLEFVFDELLFVGVCLVRRFHNFEI